MKKNHSKKFHDLLIQVKDINILMIRGFHKLPIIPDTDIDIVVHPNDYDKFIELCESDNNIISDESKIYKNKENIYRPFFTSGDEDKNLPNGCFRLDIYNNIFFGKKFTLHSDLVNIIFENKCLYKQLYSIPDPSWEFILLLLRICYEKKGKINDKYMDRLKFLITQFSFKLHNTNIELIRKYHVKTFNLINDLLNKYNLNIEKNENHAFIFWTEKAVDMFNKLVSESNDLSVLDYMKYDETDIEKRYQLINNIYEIEIPREHFKVKCQNPILIYVVKNKDPEYDTRITLGSKIEKVVNISIFNLKKIIRSHYKINDIHSSDEASEANKIFTTFGLDKYNNLNIIIPLKFLKIVEWIDRKNYRFVNIEDSSHYANIIGNKIFYQQYLKIEKIHKIEEFDKLIQEFDSNRMLLNEDMIVINILENGLCIIVDGAYRSSLIKYCGYQYIIAKINPLYSRYNGYNKKILIEVGSFDGSDSLRLYDEGYRVYTFEPNKKLFETLSEKTKKLKDFTVINKAVYIENGYKKFNLCKEGGANSLLEFRSHDQLEQIWGKKRIDIHYSGESYEVETIRLDTFIEMYSLENRKIDYLHIDAQGVDLECLMSLGKYIKNVEQGILETVMEASKTIYENQYINIFNNVKNFLEENNFRIRKIKNNDKTNCEYNIYFIKK